MCQKLPGFTQLSPNFREPGNRSSCSSADAFDRYELSLSNVVKETAVPASLQTKFPNEWLRRDFIFFNNEREGCCAGTEYERPTEHTVANATMKAARSRRSFNFDEAMEFPTKVSVLLWRRWTNWT
jgi:hypothetical protein